jgi:hypothetical protein
VKAVITRSTKTMAEPKAKLKKTGSTAPVEEEEKAEVKVEVEPRSKEEEGNLGKASPKDISDTHLLPFPRQMKKAMEDETFSRFVEVIRRMYVHIPMLDAMQVPTYARYLISTTRSGQYLRRTCWCLWKGPVLLSLMVFRIRWVTQVFQLSPV